MRSLLRGVVVASFLSVPTAAVAQFGIGQGEKAPIWAVLSVGRGDLQVNCAICREVDQSSWAADLALGGWLNARTTLGGEMGMWRLGGDEATQRVIQGNDFRIQRVNFRQNPRQRLFQRQHGRDCRFSAVKCQLETALANVRRR